jgi:hypothetical protein
MLGFTRWLKPHAVCHVVATGLCLSGGAGVYADRSGTHQTRSGHMSAPDPCLGPVQGPSLFYPRTPFWVARTPYGGGGGPDPIPGVRLVHVEVLDQPWRSRLYIQGSGTLPWGSRLTVETLGYITFSGHVAAPNPAHVVGSGAVVDLELSPEVGASHGLVPHTTPLPRD